MKWWVFAFAVITAAGCSSDQACKVDGDLEPTYRLNAPGIEVEISTDPYQVHVIDGSGTEVLTTGDGADGYAPASWATGNTYTRPFPTPGYFQFDAVLDPWRDFEVVGAESVTPTSVVLRLHEVGNDDAPCVSVAYTVRDSTLRVEARVLDDTVPRAWSTGFATTPDEGFLGFGERFNKTDQRGKAIYSYAEEGGIGTGEGMIAGPDNPYPYGEAMTYYPVPFFVSTHGYGFWLDTTYRSQFELATERDDAWRAWEVGPTLAYEVYTKIPDDPRPWPYQIIDLFTAATGRPMTAPPWVYGPRRRIGPSSMANGVTEDRAMRDADLAITAIDDAVHFYPNGSHIGREAELSAWIARANALGYRVNGYFNSMINQAPDSPLASRADEGVADHYFFQNTDGDYPNVFILTGGNWIDLYVVDFTSDAASAWYSESFDWATDLGYSGWMYDFGEYVQADVVASNGMSGEELHNLYPVLYARTVHDHMEAGPHAGDWLAFMRSGYTGSSAFVPAMWSGDPAASFEDSDGLPSMVRAGINVGISGVPNFAGDIGGYHCVEDHAEAADGELLARWIEQGALSPVMQDQNACVGGDPSLKANIWNSQDAQDAWRTYARLHTRLFPYLYTLGKQATATGAPIMRHVFLEHPDRPDLAGEDTAYYFGPALYVAPVIERGARDKTVDLPAGDYLDWQRQTLVEGGTTVTLPAPLDTLPLLLRAGYLVPMLDPTIDTLSEESDPDIVSPADVADVYDVVGLLSPDAPTASFELYDGTTLEATWNGGYADPALQQVNTDAKLATCDACFRRTQITPSLDRVQISVSDGTTVAGGLSITSATGRRVRWDLYLVSP